MKPIKYCELCDKRCFGHGYCRNHYYSEYLGKLSCKQLVKLGLKCKFRGCKKWRNYKFYCSKHQNRFKRYGDPKIKLKLSNNGLKCKVKNCSDIEYCRRYCSFHYNIVFSDERIQKYRKIIFEYFGSFCVKCGISDFDVLTVDHINNDGYKLNNKIHTRRESYHKLIKRIESGENLKKYLQLLCWNCNYKKHLQNNRIKRNKKLKGILS